MIKIFTHGLLLVLLAACTLPAQKPAPSAARPVATEATCVQQGGEWKQLGRLPVKRCLLRTSDAGKPCNGSGQCEGLCVAPEGTTNGAKVAGACSVDNNPFGCRQRLVDGKALTMCVD